MVTWNKCWIFLLRGRDRPSDSYLPLVPETGRLSLEKIDDYYDSRVPPWKTSLTKNKKAEKAQYLRADQSDIVKSS